MGDSTSTPIYNAYMSEFEKDVLTRYRHLHDPPHIPPALPSISSISVILFWFCQADDTMTAIHRDHVAPFHAFLNSILANIKWTFESEEAGRINMLDLTILRQPNGSPEFDVYRKPTHTNQDIVWDSDKPPQHKGSTILSLTRCARLLPTGPICQAAELKKDHQALALNGYPSWAIKRYLASSLLPSLPYQ
jgi:hypothetical protein